MCFNSHLSCSKLPSLFIQPVHQTYCYHFLPKFFYVWTHCVSRRLLNKNLAIFAENLIDDHTTANSGLIGRIVKTNNFSLIVVTDKLLSKKNGNNLLVRKQRDPCPCKTPKLKTGQSQPDYSFLHSLWRHIEV